MGTRIRIRRSTAPSHRPSLSQLQTGELALNTYDGRLFAIRDEQTSLGIGSTVTLLTPWTENIGGGIYYTDSNVGIGTTVPTSTLHVVGDSSFDNNLGIGGNLTVNGTTDFVGVVTFRGGTLNLGDSDSDDIFVGGEFSSGLTPTSNLSLDLGTATKQWAELHAGSVILSGVSTFNNTVDFNHSVNIVGVTTFQDDIFLGNDDRISLGAGLDLQIYNDGANSYIVDDGVGDLFIRGTAAIRLQNKQGTENYAVFNVDSAAELYFDGNKKLETTGAGVTITGNLGIPNHLTVAGISTLHDLNVDGKTDLDDLSVSGISTFQDLDVDGITELDDLNVSGVSTFANFVDINSGVNISGNAYINNARIGLATVTNLEFTGSITGGDNDQIVLGNDADLRIYHTGSHGFIDNFRNHLYIRNNVDDDDGGNIYIQAKSNENSIVIYDDSSVYLYHNGVSKFATNASGVSVFGTLISNALDVSGGAEVDGRFILRDSLYITDNLQTVGVSTLGNYTFRNDVIEGPAEVIIDPAGIGDNTGLVRIKGDLYVDGEQFIVSSSTIELADHVVGIASTTSSDLLTDGAGISIGGDSVSKTFTYNQSSDALKSSEHLDVALNKSYKINGTEVLRSGQLTIGNAVITGVSTLTTINGTNLTYTTVDIDNAYVTTGIVTTLQGTDVTYENLYGFTGIVTTIQGTDVTYDNAYVTTGIVTTLQGTDVTYDNAYVTTGIVTTLQGTDVTYDNAYVTTGIITTLQGTDVTYDNAYVTTGIITTLQGTDVTYDNAYVTTGIITTLQGTDVTYDNAYVTTGIVTTLQGTDVTYDNAYVTTGIVTTLQGTDVTYDNAYVTTGIVTTLQGTDVTYDNAYVTTGVVTSITGTKLVYSGLSTFTSNLDVDTELRTPSITTKSGGLQIGAAAGQYITFPNNLVYVNSSNGLWVTNSFQVFNNAGTENILDGTTKIGSVGSGYALTVTRNRDVDISSSIKVSGISTLNSFVDINSDLDVEGKTDLDDLEVSGVTTFTGGSVGTTRIGFGNTELIVEGDARITGILTIGTSSVTIDGDNNQINVGAALTIDGTSNVIYLGDDVTIDNSGLAVAGVSSITATTIYGDIDGELNAPGNTYYVAKTGDNNHTGDNLNQPYLTIEKALSVAGNGDIIYIAAGVYSETCPLTVPRGVTVKGSGLRSTTIKPTDATKTENVFHLNDISTLEDFTITDSFYRTSGDTGYAFAYAPGIAITSRSPYVQRVTVLNKGSIVSSGDPYGYDTADSPPTSHLAGRGAKVDGSLVTSDSLEAGMLFNEVTFFTPNNKGVILTNGARAEYLNCFHYFASQAIVGVSGSVGINSTAGARLNVVGNDVSPSANDVVKQFNGNGDVVAIGTVASFSSPHIVLTEKGSGIFTAIGAGSTNDVRFYQSDGTTQTGVASRVAFADYAMFGAEMRSVGCAVEYGSQGVVADGDGVNLRMFALNFNHVGSGKDFSNDPTLANQGAETTELNDGQVSYVSIDHKGDFRVGESFVVNQETGNVSFAATTFNLEVTGSMDVTDGSDTSTLTPTTLSIGNLQLNGNKVSSVAGDITIDPAGSNKTLVQGDLGVVGILTAQVLDASALQKGDTSVAVDDTGSDGTIRLNTDGVEAMRVDNQQRIGIGTAAPATHLDILGNTDIEGQTQIIGDLSVSGVSTLPILNGTDLTYTTADIDNAYVTTGIVTTLQGTDATYTNLYGVAGIVTTISGTDVNYTNANLSSADIDNAYVTTGIVTTLQGTDVFYTNGNFTSVDIDNAYVTTGIITTLQGTDVTYTNLYGVSGVVTTIAGSNLNYTQGTLDSGYVVTGIVTTLQGTDVTYTNAYVTTGIVTTLQGTDVTYANSYVTTGIITTLQGTDVTYDNAYVNTGVVTTLSGTDVFYTNGNFTSADIDNAYVTTGIVTTISGTDVNYTNANLSSADIDSAYVTTGIITTISGTDVNYTNANLSSADIDNAYVTTGIVTTLQGTDVFYTNGNFTSADIDNAYVTTGIVTTLQGTDVFYTNANLSSADIDNAYITTGIVTTISGTDVNYTNANLSSADIDNAYVTTGIVTTIQGTDASYTNVYANVGVVTTLNIPGNLDVDGKTDLDDVSVAGVATFSGSVGGGVTSLVVEGDQRITGILTVGTASVTVNGTTTEVHVGSATTIHTGGYQIGNSDIHSSGSTFEHSNVLGVSTVGVELSAGGVVTANTGGLNVAGVTTATAFHTGAEGSAIRVTSDTISGPATLNIDPAGVGDNTGTVVIKGDLQVDGTQTIVNSNTVTIDDKNIVIASGAANDAAADGGGITLESGEGNKTINWVDSTDSWTFSENVDIALSKTYNINGVEVLSATTLGSSVVNSSLTGVGTITSGTWQGTVIANDYLANSSISIGGIQLSLGGTDESPALNLQDATNYPYASLAGVTTSIDGDTTPQLGGNLDLNSNNITGTGNVDITGSVTASAAINSSTDVQINGTSVLTSASDEAVALAIALG